MEIEFDINMNDDNVKNILAAHFENVTGVKISSIERYGDGFCISVKQTNAADHVHTGVSSHAITTPPAPPAPPAPPKIRTINPDIMLYGCMEKTD